MTREERKQKRLEKKKLNREYKIAERKADIMKLRSIGLENLKEVYKKICGRTYISKILWAVTSVLGWGFLIPNIVFLILGLPAISSLSVVASVMFCGGIGINCYRGNQEVKKDMLEEAIEQEEFDRLQNETNEMCDELVKQEETVCEIRDKAVDLGLIEEDKSEGKGLLSKAYEKSKVGSLKAEEEQTEDKQIEQKDEEAKSCLSNTEFWFND